MKPTAQSIRSKASNSSGIPRVSTLRCGAGRAITYNDTPFAEREDAGEGVDTLIFGKVGGFPATAHLTWIGGSNGDSSGDRAVEKHAGCAARAAGNVHGTTLSN